jgi:choline dehydrogenase-like flavoprotein
LLLDGYSIQEGATLRPDVCIIGAGAAGITLALELSKSPQEVCLLESGSFELDQGTQALYRGENVGAPYFLLDSCRLRFFGGTSNHWGGLCGKLSAFDFEQRPWIPHSGWPFSLSELEPYYERARPILRIDTHPFDLGYWEDPKERPRLPLPPQVHHSVNIFSPAVRFGRAYRKDVVDSKNLTLVTHANVLELEADETAGSVAGVPVQCLNGPRFRVEARHYVLAAGGIENPRLLLLSRSGWGPGPGNAHGLVGRYFAEHPFVSAGTLLPSDPYVRVELYDDPRLAGLRGQVVMTLSEELQEKEKLSHCSYILLDESEDLSPIFEEAADSKELFQKALEKLPPDEFEEHVRAILGDIDSLLQTYERRKSRGRPVKRFNRFTLLCRPEQIPNPDSRVSLSRERDELGKPRVQLDWRLLPQDEASVRRTLEILAQDLGASGVGRMKVNVRRDDRAWSPPHDQLPWTGPVGSSHHMGTTRMHVDARHGVVDPDCRVHGVSNLFVAGSSVFPTSGHVPPTFTIVALALRLADHLKERALA